MNLDRTILLRWIAVALVLATTAAATLKLAAIFDLGDGLGVAELLLLAIFALLFSWIAASFWVACVGAWLIWSGADDRAPARVRRNPDAAKTRVALVMPICNEDCHEVTARIQAIVDSLREFGALERFDVFLLSDTGKPALFAAEQQAWRRLRDANPDAEIFYRRRLRNTGRKAGNVADFCVNWGALYEYMVVLDADSVMSAATLVALAQMMDANPRTALIQAAPLLVGGETLFARMQQFAAWVYGPVYAAGLARVQGADGNYWGHNAIIRVRPFMQNCGLPRLPGRPPLGGEIMSHDFVEAALLRRAGWDIWLVSNLGGSYEASPPNLLAHLKRDQRWCQGNLQHIKLLFARGLRLQSRIHLAFGAMSYLSSPLWLLLLILFAAEAVRLHNLPAVTFIGRYPVLTWPVSHAMAFLSLISATAILLYGPKLLAVGLLLRNAEALRQFGGAGALLVSAVSELLFSTLLAPVLMLSHSYFVTAALVGRSIEWGAQQRGSGGLRFEACTAAFAPHAFIACIGGVLVWRFLSGSFWWFTALLVGLPLAPILCWVTSRAEWGAAARRFKLFLVPSEAGTVAVLRRVEHCIAEGRAAGMSFANALERDSNSRPAI